MLSDSDSFSHRKCLAAATRGADADKHFFYFSHPARAGNHQKPSNHFSGHWRAFRFRTMKDWYRNDRIGDVARATRPQEQPEDCTIEAILDYLSDRIAVLERNISALDFAVATLADDRAHWHSPKRFVN